MSSESASKFKVLVIMGSVRAGRICPQISEWILSVVRPTLPSVEFELIDLKNFPLPMDDEPGIPAYSTSYANEHTRNWSAKVASANGYVFVSPQYNWGYPAVLKNSIDHIYKEWSGKPVAIVNYGGHGGNKCGEQLRQIFECVKLPVVPTKVEIKLRMEILGGQKFESKQELESYTQTVITAFKELHDLLNGAKNSTPAAK